MGHLQPELSDNAIKTHCKMLVWNYNDAFLKAQFSQSVFQRELFSVTYIIVEVQDKKGRQKTSFSSLSFLFLSSVVRIIISALKKKKKVTS